MPSVLNPEALEAEDLDKVDEKWGSLLSDHFAASAPDAFSHFEKVFEERPSSFLWAQVATHLECLGYLGDLDQSGPPSGPELQRAFTAWQHDQDSALDQGVHVDLGDDERIDKLSDLERRIRLLKAHCSFEGETTIDSVHFGESDSLASRIARHRLRCYGLLSFEAGIATFDRKEAAAILQCLTRPSDPDTDLINLLGDLPELTSRFVQTQHKHVFAFAKEEREAAGLLSSYRIRRRRRLGLGQRSFRAKTRPKNRSRKEQEKPQRASKLGHLLEPALVKQANENKAMPAPAMRQFSLCLLQVRLWTYGYYAGALDGQWGLMMAKALDRFVIDHESDSEKEHELAKRSKWMIGGSHALVIDLSYFFSFVVARLDEAAEVTARSEIDALISGALGSDPDDADTQQEVQAAEVSLTEEITKAHLERREGQARDRLDVASSGQSKKPRRRRYFGWRSVFSFMGRAIGWVGRSIKKALRWIREKIHQFKHYATTLLNYIREKTRRAVQLASLGIQRLKLWITGAPLGTQRGSSLLVSKFYRDFDTVNFSMGPIDTELARDHLNRIDALNAGFGFLVEVGLSVWSVVSSLKYAFGNWLLIAWRAYRCVRRALTFIDEHEHLLEKLEPAVL